MLKPTNYILLGPNGPDSLKFVRSDSTQTIRKDLTFNRKSSTYNASSKTFSIPEYRFVFRNDTPNTDEMPTGQRASFDVIIRTPVGTAVSELQAQLADVKEILDDPDFIQAVIQQRFPLPHEA